MQIKPWPVHLAPHQQLVQDRIHFRDGMNLVAKEFVACRTRQPGVLILSPFAGAGEMMHEALLGKP